jgi:hypothetical protein
MKLSSIVNKINKNVNTKILWIVFSVIIGFVIVQQFNFYEGIMYVDGKYNTNTQKVVIQPFIKDKKGKYNADYLHLSQFMLYGENGKIDYNAESSNGIYDSEYNTDKLTDNDKNTIFHSKDENATLTVTPKNGSTKITKILIRNRLDCCLDRLRGYNLSIIRNDGSVFFSKNLNELPNLYTYPYMEEILIN